MTWMNLNPGSISSLLPDCKIVVTGGAGFIGSHLVSRLLGSTRNIRAIDSLKYGVWKNIVGDIRSDALIHANLVDLSTSDMARQLEGCDVLFHFAAEKHNNTLDTLHRVIEANISATARLFDAAGKSGVSKVVFASSLYAYGRLAGTPMTETEVPRPATVYGVSKLAGEGLLRETAKRHGYRHVSLRLFFVYGPRQYAGTGYPSIIVKNFMRIRNREAPVVFGDGSQVLDYVFVDDVVRAVLLAAASSLTDEVINIGSGVGTSVQHLTERMLRVARSDLAPVYAPPDWTAQTWRVANIGKASALLGFRPEIDLDLGLKRVWSWIAQ